jgi:hypothetical protein
MKYAYNYTQDEDLELGNGPRGMFDVPSHPSIRHLLSIIHPSTTAI